MRSFSRIRKKLSGLLIATSIGLTGSALSAPALAQDASSMVAESTQTIDTPQLTQADVDTWLDGMIPSALEEGELPGAIVSVVKDGKVLVAKGYGAASVEKREAATADSLYRVGSVSKIPTAIAALQLVEAGKIDVDADISEYVDVPIDRQFEEPITMRNLLDHTAGFEEFHKGNFAFGDAEYNIEENMLADPPEQVFRPGSTMAYSNYGITLAGYIVQEVSGIPFEQYVEENIFAPAGMDSTTFRQPLPEELKARMASGYAKPGADPFGWETVISPAGAMTTSANDFARFMIAQLNGTLLNEEMTDFAWRPHGDEQQEYPTAGTRVGQGYFIRVGQGYFIQDRNGQKVVGHSGDTNVFHANFELYPEHNTGIFISINGNGQGAASHTLREELAAGFADRYFPEKAASKQPQNIEGAKQRAEEIAGTYMMARSFKSTFLRFGSFWPSQAVKIVSHDDGIVTVTLAGVISMDFEETSEGLWQEVGGDRHMSVEHVNGTTHINVIGMAARQATVVERLVLPITIISALLLVFVLVIWVAGGIRNVVRNRKGLSASEPLSHFARNGRIGALLLLVALGCWTWFNIDLFPGVGVVAIRATQVLQYLGALCILNAGIALVGAIRAREKIPRIIVAVLLVLGMLGLIWVGIVANFFSFDIGY